MSLSRIASVIFVAAACSSTAFGQSHTTLLDAASDTLLELRNWADQYPSLSATPAAVLKDTGERPATESMVDFCASTMADSATASRFAVAACSLHSGDLPNALKAFRDACNDPRDQVRLAAVGAFVDLLSAQKAPLRAVLLSLDANIAAPVAEAFYKKGKLLEADAVYGWLAVNSVATTQCKAFAAKALVLGKLGLVDQSVQTAALIDSSIVNCVPIAIAVRCQLAIDSSDTSKLIIPRACSQYRNFASLAAVTTHRTFPTNTASDNWKAAIDRLVKFAGSADVDRIFIDLAKDTACTEFGKKQIRSLQKSIPKRAMDLRKALAAIIANKATCSAVPNE
jgi:hypothetical protein